MRWCDGIADQRDSREEEEDQEGAENDEGENKPTRPIVPGGVADVVAVSILIISLERPGLGGGRSTNVAAVSIAVAVLSG